MCVKQVSISVRYVYQYSLTFIFRTHISDVALCSCSKMYSGRESHSCFTNVLFIHLFLVLFIYRLIVKLLKGNNRIMLGLALTLCLIGCVLIGDWQAINGPTCSTPANSSSVLESSGSTSGENELTSSLSLSQHLRESCEGWNNSRHCFWNPYSRVTGDFCNTCLDTCLSEKASLNFYQFSAGVFSVAVGSLLGCVFMNVLTSDITPVESQVISECTISVLCAMLSV